MAVAHNFAEKARTNDVMTSESVDFAGLLLSKPVLNGLKNAGFERPSPIQLKAIPLGRCGLDLIVQAKSGTGKTCVFSVVALEGIETTARSTQVLVLAPTREIALQIWEVINSIGSAMSGLQCHTFIGGLPVHEDRKKLQLCHIAVGTPGRIQSLIDQGILKTDNIRLFILDEADKLLEESFQSQINWIYSALPDNKQMLALSATYPEYLAEHLTLYMRNPTFVRLNITDPTLLGIKQYYTTVASHPLPNKAFDLKTAAVLRLLSSVSFHQCLIFSNLQTRAQNLESELTNEGWPTTCIAGCLDQKDRIQAMHKLKSYKCRVLISTDLTSRGIDADRVNLVINLDVPKDHETYLHRIGRAGRFGSYGAGVSIVSEGQEMIDLQTLEHRISTCIQPLPDPIPSDLVKRQLQVNLDDVVSTEQLITRPDNHTWPHSPSSHSLHPANTQSDSHAWPHSHSSDSAHIANTPPGPVQPHNGLPSTEETALEQDVLCQPRGITTKSCDLISQSPGQASEHSAKTSSMPGLSSLSAGHINRDSVQREHLSETASPESTKLLADAGLPLDVEQDAGPWFVERGGRQSGDQLSIKNEGISEQSIHNTDVKPACVGGNGEDTTSLACVEHGGSLPSQDELSSSQLVSGEQGGADEQPAHVSQDCFKDRSRPSDRESARLVRNNIAGVEPDVLMNGNKSDEDRNLNARGERLDESDVNKGNNGMTNRETDCDDMTLTDTCTNNNLRVLTEVSAAGDANRKLSDVHLTSLSKVSDNTKGSRDSVSETDNTYSAGSKNTSSETAAKKSANNRNANTGTDTRDNADKNVISGTDAQIHAGNTNSGPDSRNNADSKNGEADFKHNAGNTNSGLDSRSNADNKNGKADTKHNAGKTGTSSTDREKVAVKRRGRGKASADLWSSLLCGEQNQDMTSSHPEPPTPSPHSAPVTKSCTPTHNSPQSDKPLSWESELALYVAARSKGRQGQGEGEDDGNVTWEKTETSRPVSKARRRLGKTRGQEVSDSNTQLPHDVPNVTAVNKSPECGAASAKLFSFTQPTSTKTVTVNGEEPAVHYTQSKPNTATTVSDTSKTSFQKADKKKPVATNSDSSDVIPNPHTPYSAPQPTVQYFSEKRVCPPPISMSYQGRCSRPVRGVTYSAALQDYEAFLSQSDTTTVLTPQHIVAKTFTVPPALDKTQCAQLDNFLLHFHAQLTDRRSASLTHTDNNQSNSNTQLAKEAVVTQDKRSEVTLTENDCQNVKDGPALPEDPQPSPTTGSNVSKTKNTHVTPNKSVEGTHVTDDQQNNNVDKVALSTNTDTDTGRQEGLSEKRVQKGGPPGKSGEPSMKTQDKAGRPRRYRPMAVCGPATQHMFQFDGEVQGAVDVADDSSSHTQTTCMTRASLPSPLTRVSNSHMSPLTGDTVSHTQAMLSQHANVHTPQGSGTRWDVSGGKGAIPKHSTADTLKTGTGTYEEGRGAGHVSQPACTSHRQQGNVQKPSPGHGAVSRPTGALSHRQQAGSTRSKQTTNDAANSRRTQNNTNSRQPLKTSANSRQPHGSAESSEDSDSEDSDEDSTDKTSSSSEGDADNPHTEDRERSVCIENHYAVEGGGRGASRKLRSITHRREHRDKLASDSSSLDDAAQTGHSFKQRFHPRSVYYDGSGDHGSKHRPDPARSDYYAVSHDHAWPAYTSQAHDRSQRGNEIAAHLRSSRLWSGSRHAGDEPSPHSDYGHHWGKEWTDGRGSHPHNTVYQSASAHHQSQYDYSPYQPSTYQETTYPWHNPYSSPWSVSYTYPPSQTAQQPGFHSFHQHNPYSFQASQRPNPYYQSTQPFQQPSSCSYPVTHPNQQHNLYSYPPNQHPSSHQQYWHSAWPPQHGDSMKTGVPPSPSYVHNLSQVQAARAHSLMQYTRKMARFYARVCDHAA